MRPIEALQPLLQRPVEYRVYDQSANQMCKIAGAALPKSAL
jgi:hypothetical protein